MNRSEVETLNESNYQEFLEINFQGLCIFDEGVYFPCFFRIKLKSKVQGRFTRQA